MSLSYQNPLPIRHIGDPFVHRAADGTYYLYATSAPDGFKAWSSPNLVDWTDEGYIYRRTTQTWGQSDFWAPEVVYHQGSYIMHYSARWGKNDSLRIGVAVSASPLGPFADAFDRPMFDFGYAAIDGHVFMDDHGKAWFYYARDCSELVIDGRHESHIYVAGLSGDLFSLQGEPIWLTRPEQPWEIKSGSEWRWNEGPFMLKHAGRYYMMYSANFYASRDYSVGYAVADSPTGPFVKSAANPVLASNSPEVSGPGHNSVTTAPGGQLMAVYHIHTNPLNPSGDRQVCMDAMGFNSDSSLFVHGPTRSKQHLP